MKALLKNLFRCLFLRPGRKLFGTMVPLPLACPVCNEENEKTRMLIADLLIRRMKSDPSMSFQDAEFSAFSQYGEDGIIQYLIDRIKIENKTFVEFGVENFTESNTRFLLMHDNWSGLIIDGCESNVREIMKSSLYWRHDLTSICSFITCENINSLISTRFQGDIGILSIDIDGNDYWVWEAIDVVSPRIVICEYNSRFGKEKAVSIPYRADFVRRKAHYSNLYFGASLPALCRLAAKKGYVFVGCNTAGNDAFFVRRDIAANVFEQSITEGYVKGKFRESRDPDGSLTFLSANQELRLIAEMPVIDLEMGIQHSIESVLS